jgi:hypothetical protein
MAIAIPRLMRPARKLEPTCVCAWTTKAADEQDRLLIPFPKKKNPKHPRTEYSKQGEPLAQEQIEPQHQVHDYQLTHARYWAQIRIKAKTSE